MALYEDEAHVLKGQGPAFAVVHNPGAATPHSGIYRCISCGDEVASNAPNPLPPQNHHQHNPNVGPIRWKLLVFAQQH
jgi:hypothetical protein